MSRSVTIVGTTGGVATGKTTFNHRLVSRTGAEFFDSDACSRILLDDNLSVRKELRSAFGKEVFDPQGKPDRVLIREMVFRNPDDRRTLEAIIHPRVRRAWCQQIALIRQAGEQRLFIVDVPLLYEIGAEEDFDLIIVVACQKEMQIARMIGDRGLSPETAKGIVAAQWSVEQKTQRSNTVVWNDGSLATLDAQVDLVAQILLN